MSEVHRNFGEFLSCKQKKDVAEPISSNQVLQVKMKEINRNDIKVTYNNYFSDIIEISTQIIGSNFQHICQVSSKLFQRYRDIIRNGDRRTNRQMDTQTDIKIKFERPSSLNGGVKYTSGFFKVLHLHEMTLAFLSLTYGLGHTSRSKLRNVEVSTFSKCFLFSFLYFFF